MDIIACVTNLCKTVVVVNGVATRTVLRGWEVGGAKK